MADQPGAAASDAPAARRPGARREPVARTPVAPAPPTAVVAGWEVSGRRSDAALRLVDVTPLTKVLVGGSGTPPSDVGLGEAARDVAGALVVGSAPGEWLLLAPPDAREATLARARALHGARVDDLTYGRALLRLHGAAAPEVLAKLCALDLAGTDRAALTTSFAGIVVDVVRDAERSWLLGCEWSLGQELFDALVDAGAEFGIDVDGFVPPGL